MQILVSGKQLDVGDALRSHVDERLQNGVAKYFSNPLDARVVFSREGQGYRADCSVHVGQGIHAQARAEAADIYQAFDHASERLEKRLRRYKRRLRDHHGGERPERDGYMAQSYVLESESEADEVPEEFQPVIVAEHTTDIHRRTVGQAVMQLDLAEQPVLMFRNSGNGHLNVVYRRPDGHIGWIDLVADASGNSDAGNDAGNNDVSNSDDGAK
ncbi:MAG: ribosome-associated translation inhibitor RaiA [Rhodospirillaceae bacterium]|jgi:ribosomal subunit interface protein|nr:ribosome-associated translation inhibitor RaiA [Rhodospirillaceae bacterium]MBT5192990.1 ribosome-associated translation inhibitor RaiA [Rhodospirillaceae bacterium]MBT5896940.1 ribosome-associated translation inhibitor RaiA [Rhodospirillaceae bacterium]MBT6429835.1 ribosome-associated translation inhibitor RaiA [Rhodospirillaceae bacterium]MBT7760095.1 ribosome-associated translation inhibitor RaiA [Rhodospirillaceae bacterium]